MSSDTLPVQRTRAPRAETERAERTRRRTSDPATAMNLWVDESKLDRRNYAYRWINDHPHRVRRLTENDDWDFVPEESVGFNTERHAEIAQQNGQTAQIRARLARKPIDLYHEDHAKNEEKRKAVMEQRLGSANPASDAAGVNLSNGYKPNDTTSMTFERGSRIE